MPCCSQLLTFKRKGGDQLERTRVFNDMWLHFVLPTSGIEDLLHAKILFPLPIREEEFGTPKPGRSGQRNVENAQKQPRHITRILQAHSACEGSSAQILISSPV